MSRVGLRPIPLPDRVKVTIDGNEVVVTGPRGTLNRAVHPDMKVLNNDGVVSVERPSDERDHRSLHGLTRTLIANMVEGVSDGFNRSLELVGVGYRVQQSGKGVSLSVMKSHTVEYTPREGIELEVEGNNIIRVRGIDKQAVGQTAAEIRLIRPPNAYTGKGVRYAGEEVRIKPGKSARREAI